MADSIGTAYVEVKGDLTQLHSDVATALAPAKLGKIGKTGGLAMGAALGAGVAAAVGGAVVTKALYDLGAQFDDAFDKIRVGTGKTGKPLKQLQKDFKAVFASVPTDANTAATAIADLSKRLDTSGKPLRALSKNMLELSRMTDTDLQGNIQSVSRLFGDWGVKTAQQVPTLDKLWRASQKTGIGVKDLSDLMVQFGSPLRNLGFDFDTAAAMFSKFEKEGVNIQTAMPGLRMALKNFAKDGRDPQQALLQTFKAIDKAGSTAKANTIAFDVFGTRAGPDLAAAVREGRFEFDDIIKSMSNGKDTIMKSSKDTRDFGENMNILGNKLKVVFQPLGSLVYNAVSKMSGALANLPIRRAVKDVQRFVKTNKDFRSVLNAVRVALKVLGTVSKAVWGVMKEQFKGAWTYVKGGLLALKGLVKIVSGVLKGDFGRAWSGVKDLFRGSVKIVLGIMRAMSAPFRAVLKKVGSAMSSIFRGAWNKVEGVFESGANAVIGVINKIIDVINLIPGVNVEGVGTVSFGGGDNLGKDANGKSQGRQRGGTIYGGKPSGDSVPALLERGEYVLNREAVKKVGVERLDDLNFKQAARFQKGGRIGLINGGFLGDIAGAALGAAGSIGNQILDKGADFLIDKLPDPNIPQPLTPVGPYAIDKAQSFIKDAVAQFVKTHQASNTGEIRMYKGFPMADWVIGALEHAAEKGAAPQPTSGYRDPERNAAAGGAKNSQHMLTVYPGGAVDFGGFTTGYSEKMSVVNATKDYKYPLLAPIGFSDDGHASGTGHQLGGLIQGMISGGKVVKIMAQDLVGKHGWTKRAAAGIIGNAYQESTWDPGAMEGGLSNGGLFGFTTSPVSLEEMQAFASHKGEKWTDVKTQVHFMLNHGQPTGESLRGAMNHMGVSEATAYFMNEWERPNPTYANLPRRVQGAHKAYKMMKSGKWDLAGGDSGPSAAEIAAKKSKRRKGDRTDKLGEMRKAVKEAKTQAGKQSALWRLIAGWGKFGEFEGKEENHILDVVRRASKMPNPLQNLPVLGNLAQYMRKKGEVSGEDSLSDKFVDKIKKLREKGEDKAETKRNKIFKRISSKGLKYPLRDALMTNDDLLQMYEERIDMREQLVSSESGPGGSDTTDAELKQLVFLYSNKFDIQKSRRRQVKQSIGYLGKVRKQFQTLMEAVREGKDTSKPFWKKKTLNAVSGWRPDEWMKKNAWKYPAFKKGVKQANDTIGSTRDEDGLLGQLRDLVGLTGNGGEMFNTRLRLKELGVTVTKEQSDADAANAGISMSDVLQIVESSKYNVFDRMPKFHSGGDVPGSSHEEVMALVKARESVFTEGQTSRVAGALAGGGPVDVQVVVHDGAVDTSKIEVITNGQIQRHERMKVQRAKAGVR